MDRRLARLDSSSAAGYRLAMSQLRQAREAIVRAHMDAENEHRIDATLATFSQPRYEVIPSGEILDGAGPVEAFLGETFSAFPDVQFATDALHHAEAGVIAEVTFRGTHDGSFRGLPGTGRRIEYRMC